MRLTIIQLILEISTVIIGLYLIFFKSYFSEKGKQLALKQDVEEITEKVEGIKKTFSTQIEILKSNLQIINSNKINVNTKKQNYLLEYYSLYSIWRTAVFNASPSQISENITRSDISQNLDKMKQDFEVISLKAELFFSDEKYYETCKKLTVNLINYQSIVEQYLIKAEYINFQKKLLDNEPNVQLRTDKFQALQDELVSYVNELSKTKLNYINILTPIEVNMKNYFLKQIEEMNNEIKTNA